MKEEGKKPFVPSSPGARNCRARSMYSGMRLRVSRDPEGWSAPFDTARSSPTRGERLTGPDSALHPTRCTGFDPAKFLSVDSLYLSISAAEREWRADLIPPAPSP